MPKRKESRLSVTIYNPALLKKDDLIRGFVARRPLLDRLLGDLRGEAPNRTPQHHFIVGQRGLGKTTLLHRLAFGVEDDAELSAAWMPLVFPEEQYNVASLADFWLNCVDALSDALDRIGDRTESASLDAKVEAMPDGESRSRLALDLLLGESERLGKRILLLVDNFDIVLDRLKDREEWEFRRVISEEPRLHIIGASSRVLEALYQHGRAFYDFFQIHELKGFDEEETISTLCHLAEESRKPEVAEIVRKQPARIKAVRLLTGGNPRTLTLLFKVLAQGPDGDVQHDMEQLLDEHTALYKARFEELAPQAQQVVNAMALHWDPLTAADLADQLRPLSVNQVSAQLKRLENFGVIEKTPWFGENKTAFQIAERFFNIWYLMRASRRVRRKLLWLVKFLEIWFDKEELSARARSLLDRAPESLGRERYMEMALAYSQAVPDKHLRLNLESASLHAVLDDGVRRLIDFSDLPQELLDKKDRMQQLRDLRETTLNLKIEWGGIDPKEFWRLLGGSPRFSLTEKARMVEQLALLSREDFLDLQRKLRLFHQQLAGPSEEASQDLGRLYDALASGEMADAYDYENALAISKRYGLRWLPLMAIRSRIDSAMRCESMPETEVKTAEAALRSLAEDEAFQLFAWNALGNLLTERSSRYSEAEQAYARATDIEPRATVPYNGLGNLLDRLGRHDEAERAYRRAIELDPSYAQAWNNLGAFLHDRRRLDEANLSYRRAIEIDASLFHPWNNLGGLAELCGRFQDSADALLRALEIDREQSSVVSRFVGVCDRVLESASALPAGLRLAGKAHEILPDDEAVQFLLARALTLDGNWQDASDLLERIAANDSTFFSNGFFKTVVETGHVDKAIAILEKTGANDRWRPLYEALRAVQAGTADYLRTVAPEVRTVALEILREISPQHAPTA